MSDRVDLSEFRTAYLVETEELLATANASLLAAETAARGGTTNRRAIRDLFRAVHTLKGLSAMVGVEPVVAIAHRLETALRLVDREGGLLTPETIDTLLEAVRAVEQRVAAVADERPAAEPPLELLDKLDRLEAARVAPEPPVPATLLLEPGLLAKLSDHEQAQLVQGQAQGMRALRLDFAPSPERAASGLTITTLRERLAPIADIVKVVPQSVTAGGGLVFVILLLTSATDAALGTAVGGAPLELQPLVGPPPPILAEPVLDLVDPASDLARHGVVRVDVARLDDTMERLSALIVTRFRLARAVASLAAQGVNVRELREIVADNARQLRDLRAAIVRVRMVPVAELLERVPLLVRGLARATGKRVQVEIDARGAELDKAVAERLFPALVHLVRNAVDHAIQTPEERRRAGKPEEGRLTVSCHQRSNTQLELRVSDDGTGVDRAAVAARAGAPPPASDAALLELMCLPGLTTRAEATTTSGRGMGMDIIKRVVVAELGGEIALTTAPGQGTTFTLRVPLTISIVEAFSFECAAQRFVVPVSMIEEIIELDPGALVHGPRRAGPGRGAPALLERRGEVVPVVALGSLFALGADGSGAKALVVRRNGQAIAFAIDRVLGQQEIVMRPLEDPLVRVPGVAGATDLGDGRPTLVLDLSALAATIGRMQVAS